MKNREQVNFVCYEKVATTIMNGNTLAKEINHVLTSCAEKVRSLSDIQELL